MSTVVNSDIASGADLGRTLATTPALFGTGGGGDGGGGCCSGGLDETDACAGGQNVTEYRLMK